MYIESKESKELVLKNKQDIDLQHSNHQRYSKFELIKKAFNEVVETLRYSGIKRAIFKIRCRLNPRMLNDHLAKYDPNDTTEICYECKNDFTGKRIAIYTAIFGGYDQLKEPLFVSPICDYYVFTDKEVPADSIWKKLDITSVDETKFMDGYHKSKYVKIFPHKYFKDYDYSIWVDGTVTIVADLVPFVDRLCGKQIAMFDNPVHDCIYTEANFLLYYNRIPADVLSRQINAYRLAGYPSHNGMFECTIIVRNHNEEICKKLMEDWWEEICTYSMRDQISFPVVLWKNKMGYSDVVLLGSDRHFCPRLRFDNHLKTQTYK